MNKGESAMSKNKYETSQKIKVSVLIPICNVAKYLPKCIESVINQTLKEIEIICINDGSTDNSLEIIQEYALKDKRIKVIDKQNSGYGDSMNHGLKAAVGEYIGIVESDDVALDTMFEKLYALNEKGTADIVKGNYWDYYVYEDVPAKYYVNGSHDFLPEGKISIKENPQIITAQSSVWSAIYKRSFLSQNKITFSIDEMSDIIFSAETIIKAKNVIWTKEPLYYALRNNNNSLTAKQNDPSVFIKRILLYGTGSCRT